MRKKAPAERPATATEEEQARRQILEILGDHDSPAYFPKSQIFSYLSRAEKDGFGGKLTELDRDGGESRGCSARGRWCCWTPRTLRAPRLRPRQSVTAGRDGAAPVPSRPRRRSPQSVSHGSGRLDLARAITAPDNPLTSRVIVNRVWMHHFGEPMVSTPSDFGTRSTPPSHPELLDYLAARFFSGGWSLKALHRLIVLSSTYQQASFDRPQCRKVDPENRLALAFSPAPARPGSDAGHALARLGPARSSDGRPAGGRGRRLQGRRRTVYGMVDRQSLPGVFRAFDFASPDQSAERRPRTTVPQQALFSMNAPFVIEQAKALAARPTLPAARRPKPGSRRSTVLSWHVPPIAAELGAGRAIPGRPRPMRRMHRLVPARPDRGARPGVDDDERIYVCRLISVAFLRSGPWIWHLKSDI